MAEMTNHFISLFVCVCVCVRERESEGFIFANACADFKMLTPSDP